MVITKMKDLNTRMTEMETSAAEMSLETDNPTLQAGGRLLATPIMRSFLVWMEDEMNRNRAAKGFDSQDNAAVVVSNTMTMMTSMLSIMIDNLVNKDKVEGFVTRILDDMKEELVERSKGGANASGMDGFVLRLGDGKAEIVPFDGKDDLGPAIDEAEKTGLSLKDVLKRQRRQPAPHLHEDQDESDIGPLAE